MGQDEVINELKRDWLIDKGFDEIKEDIFVHKSNVKVVVYKFSNSKMRIKFGPFTIYIYTKESNFRKPEMIFEKLKNKLNHVFPIFYEICTTIQLLKEKGHTVRTEKNIYIKYVNFFFSKNSCFFIIRF